MRHGSIIIGIIAGILLLALLSCGEHEFENPFSSDYALQSIEGFTVTQLTDSSVKLTWQQNPDIVGNYLIQRKVSTTGTWETLTTLEANATQHTDTGLSTSTTYYYRLTGCNDQNRTNAQETSISTTFPPITSFSIEMQSLTSTKISWTHEYDHVSQYIITRKDITEGDEYEIIASLEGDARTYIDTSLVALHNYGYAFYGTSDVNYTDVIWRSISMTFPPPYNLEIVQSGIGNATLTWDYDIFGDEEGFIIKRTIWTGECNWIIVGTTPINTYEFTDSGLEAGTQYYYQVYAYSGDYIGNEVSGMIELNSIPIEGLVAYYPFDGNADNAISEEFNGSINGGVDLYFDRFDNSYSAYRFDGSTGYIDIGDNPNLPSWSHYSVSLWFCDEGSGEYDGYGAKIVDKTWLYHDWYLSVRENDENNPGCLSLRLYEGGDGLTLSSSGHDYRDQTWHHVVIVRDARNIYLYIDAVIIDQGISFDVESQANLAFGYCLGNHSHQLRHFGGIIDDIRIYDRKLSDEEINALYHEGE